MHAEPDERADVDRVLRDVGDPRQEEDDCDAADDGEGADGDRDCRGDDTAEREQEDEQGERQRHHLRLEEVARERLVEIEEVRHTPGARDVEQIERSSPRTRPYAASACFTSPRSATSAKPACARPLIMRGARSGPASSGVTTASTSGSPFSGASARCIASWNSLEFASSAASWKTAMTVVSTGCPCTCATSACASSDSRPAIVPPVSVPPRTRIAMTPRRTPRRSRASIHGDGESPIPARRASDAATMP